jgi:hypothetical protein
MLVAFFGQRHLPINSSFILGASITAASAMISLRGIAYRLDSNHRLLRFAGHIPGVRWICGIQKS